MIRRIAPAPVTAHSMLAHTRHEARPVEFRRFFSALGALSLLGVLSNCGGSNQPATSSTHSHAESTEATEDESFTPEARAEEPTETVKPDPCAQGQCTPCGDTVCVAGFFCDERAQACSWLPQCAKDPSCDCLQKALDGCSCESRDGGLYVTCSE